MRVANEVEINALVGLLVVRGFVSACGAAVVWGLFPGRSGDDWNGRRRNFLRRSGACQGGVCGGSVVGCEMSVWIKPVLVVKTMGRCKCRRSKRGLVCVIHRVWLVAWGQWSLRVVVLLLFGLWSLFGCDESRAVLFPGPSFRDAWCRERGCQGRVQWLRLSRLGRVLLAGFCFPMVARRRLLVWVELLGGVFSGASFFCSGFEE